MWERSHILYAGLVFLIYINTSYTQPVKTAQSDDCGIREVLANDTRTQAPWVAAIFARPNTKQKFEYRITGTVLGPTTILTIFSGAYGEPATKGGKYFMSPPFNYKIGVGLKTNRLDDKDQHTQLADVSYIVPFTGHEPENRDFHYFIFHLKTRLNLKTPYVRAACVPILAKFFGSSVIEKVKALHQGGFSVPALANGANTLQMTHLKLEDNHHCGQIYHKFYSGSPNIMNCGSLTNNGTGNKITCTLHGSVPVVPLYNNRWFIIGITALIPPIGGGKDWCNGNTVYFFGKILKAIDWIESNLKCGSKNFACGDGICVPLERLCDKKSDCSGSEDEDPIFCRARRPCIYEGKSHECGVYGECIRPEQVCDGTAHCFDGSDENPSSCAYSKIASLAVPVNRINSEGPKCPLLQQSEGVEIRCRNPESGDTVPCNEAVHGTVANLRCQNYYKSVYRLPTTESRCSEDGSWKPQRPFGCEPDCGIISSEGTVELVPFIVEGLKTTKTEAFPWHTALFYRRKDSYDFICGGSLIEKSVLAAHCVTDNAGVIRTKQNFKIAMGALSSTYADNEKNPNAQVFNAKNIWVPSTYDRRNLQSDIALIQLDKPAVFGEFVRPICYFSQVGQRLPAEGDIGKVAGLGFVNDTSISKNLMFAAFPVISTQECSTALKRIPPLSSFCAGYRNGTSVCQGDSGGGMVFQEQEGASTTRYTLKGIVSHGEIVAGKLCNPFNYAVFTHVDAYADWILQRLEGSL